MYFSPIVSYHLRNGVLFVRVFFKCRKKRSRSRQKQVWLMTAFNEIESRKQHNSFYSQQSINYRRRCFQMSMEAFFWRRHFAKFDGWKWRGNANGSCVESELVFDWEVLVCDNFNVGLLKKAHGECKLKCIYAHKSSFLNNVINLVIYYKKSHWKSEGFWKVITLLKKLKI